MSDRNIMQQALEALELLSKQPIKMALDYADNAIEVLRERLAQQEQEQEQESVQEPVAVRWRHPQYRWTYEEYRPGQFYGPRVKVQRLYTTPPQRKPVQEPVYWEVRCTAHPKWMRVDEQQFDEYVAHGWEGQRLYTSPPQRKPHTA